MPGTTDSCYTRCSDPLARQCPWAHRNGSWRPMKQISSEGPLPCLHRSVNPLGSSITSLLPRQILLSSFQYYFTFTPSENSQVIWTMSSAFLWIMFPSNCNGEHTLFAYHGPDLMPSFKQVFSHWILLITHFIANIVHRTEDLRLGKVESLAQGHAACKGQRLL